MKGILADAKISIISSDSFCMYYSVLVFCIFLLYVSGFMCVL